MMNIKQRIVALLLFTLIIFLSGCGGETEQKISGFATAILEKQTIKNGEITHLTIKGFNNGNVPVKVHFEFSSDKPEMVKLSFPSNIELTLQPGEDTGNKILTVQGFTETIKTDYLITTKLVDDTKKVIYETSTILSVAR